MAPLVDDERGYALTELIAALAVGMVVLLAIFGLLDFSIRAQAETVDRVEALQRGRLGMEVMTQQIRAQQCLGTGRPPIVAANGSSLEFYAGLADAGAEFQQVERRALFFREVADGKGDVVERVFVGQGRLPDPVFPENPTRERVLVSDVAPTESTPLFEYFAFDEANPGQMTPPLATPLEEADRHRVVQIGISFRARIERGGADEEARDTVLQNRVFVRTADPQRSRGGAQCI